MIEQFLQTALEFIKEIWFQLDSRFGLENTETFKFLKPYLTQLQDNPLYMGIPLAALFMVPYALIKFRSISRERERKLNELMEEIGEEQHDEDDPRRLGQPESEIRGEEAKPLFENDQDIPPSYIKVLDEMAGKDVDKDDFESEVESSSSDSEEAIDLEENTETISSQLTENEFEKDPSGSMSNDIDIEKGIELHLDAPEHDQAIKDVQEESPSISELSGSEIPASLEPEDKDTLDLESMLKSEAEAKPESELDAKLPPLTDEFASPWKKDSLIDRFNFLQTRFENQHQQVEQPSSPIEKDIPEKSYSSTSFIEPGSYSSASAGLPSGNKKYMDLLESFIFLKNQKKHK